MRIVVDANLLAALILPLPYSEPARRKMTAWKNSGDEIFAPVLWEYELTSALRKAVSNGFLNAGESADILRQILILNVQSVAPSEALHLSSLKWAERLKQSKAYDAQYMALARDYKAPFWTGDHRLANSAHQLGYSWVHWVGEE